MATQTYSTLTAEQATIYNKTLLARLKPELVFLNFGQSKPAPKNAGATVNFRRFESLPGATTPLTEGVTPTGSNLSISSLNATVEQFGDFVEVSDKLSLVGIDPVVTECAELCGEQAGLTIDTVCSNVVVAGTNVRYANGRANRNAITASDKLTGLEVRKAVKTLKKANVKRVDGFYIGFIGADCEFDLMDDPLWQDVSKYSGGTAIIKGEIGRIFGVRFIESNNIKTVTNTGGVVVNSTIIVGKDAYGVIDIVGSSKPEIIVKPAGSSGTSDPLNQRSTVGWKCMFTVQRLNELAMVRIESAATA